MKRPNNLFQKKYISSLVIAAFLILSVLTAYNIKIGNADGGKSDNKTKTETTEKSNDVIGPVSGNDTGSATNSADSAANNDMDVEPGAEGQNGTDTYFQGYNVPSTFEMPDYSLMPPMEDFRRTLYWNPDVRTDEKGEAIIEFYNNSSCREIQISAEGITPDGRCISNE